jgi:hypothetical protein
MREEREDGIFRGTTQDGEEADAGEVPDTEKRASAVDARTDCRNRKMA